jgi:hypothetical protein
MQEQALIRIALALTIPAVQELIRVALCESLSLRSLLLDLKSLKYCCLDLRCRQHFSPFVSETILVLVSDTHTVTFPPTFTISRVQAATSARWIHCSQGIVLEHLTFLRAHGMHDRGAL